MDGVEATRIIREDIGTDYAKNIPIIALTANAILGNEELFLQNGFQAFISKPIDIMRLDAVINQWVRDKTYEKEHPREEAPDSQGKRSGAERRIVGNRRTGRDRRGAFVRLERPPRASVLSEIVPIGGLNIHGGIRRFFGDEKAYLDVLKSYLQYTPPLLDKLEADAEANLSDFAIVVHGIKSSSRSIGADEIGSRAEMLEHAAKANDAVYVRDNNPAFIASVHKLIADIDAVLHLSDLGKDIPKRTAPDPETLEKLRTACAAFDIEGAEEAMSELERFQYETQADLIVWLREQVDVSGFKKITERLPNL
jgi:CheY-like chemotaxis protein